MGKEIELGLKNRAFHVWDERKVKEEREDLPSLYDLRRSGAPVSSSQGLKFIYETRATRGYEKQEISLRIQARSSGKSKVSGTSHVQADIAP